MRITSGLLITAAIFTASSSVAETIQGSATIIGVDNTNNLLPDFLGSTPNVSDTVEFSIDYDPTTLGPNLSADPSIGFFLGGITRVSITVNGVTLEAVTTAPGTSSVISTTSQTEILGIPQFKDGYSITGGNAADGFHWAINLFFFDFRDGVLPSIDAPQAIPNPSDFVFAGIGYRSFNGGGVTFDSFGALLDPTSNPVPAPAVGLLALLGLHRRKARVLGSSMR